MNGRQIILEKSAAIKLHFYISTFQIKGEVRITLEHYFLFIIQLYN